MDFFAAQEQARKKTRWLTFWFVLAVIGIITTFYWLPVLLFFSLDDRVWIARLFAIFFGCMGADLLLHMWKHNKLLFVILAIMLPPAFYGLVVLYFSVGAADAALWTPPYHDTFWDNKRLFWTCLIVGGIIGTASRHKIQQISRQGGELIAKQLGGRVIERNTLDLAERRLLNVVDEISIAAGIPAPVAFVLSGEASLNAFAAGLSTQDSVIGVTRGLLETMSREELQGVIAHEISHIVNGDSRLNLKLIGVLFGIYAIVLMGREMMLMGRSAKRYEELYAKRYKELYVTLTDQTTTFIFIGFVVCVIGSVGLFFGRLIQSAVSREREYLADAAAVQFTRNPDGLVSALKKLQASGSRIRHPQALVASHLFFGASETSSVFLTSLFATHPPLTERINRIGKIFLEYSDSEPLGEKETVRSIDFAIVKGDDFRVLAENPHVMMPIALSDTTVLTPVAYTPEKILSGSIAHAQTLLATLPETLRQKAQNVVGATSIVYGLLFSNQPDVWLRQKRLLPPAALPVAQELVQWLSSQPEQGAHSRLVWLDLVLPTLREAPKSGREQLLTLAAAMIHADGQLDPSKFALYSILWSTLLPPSEHRVKHSELRRERLDRGVASLLALITHAGHEDLETAKAAYQAAMAHSPTHEWVPFPDRKDLSLTKVSHTFSYLALAAPPYRKKFLEACAVAAQHDGKMTPVENELLRAFAQSLDCPAPLV